MYLVELCRILNVGDWYMVSCVISLQANITSFVQLCFSVEVEGICNINNSNGIESTHIDFK